MASVHRDPARSNEQSVPSTEIVRNFPVWQEKATKRPVYILHHGRPRSVLLSLDHYGALLAAQGSQDEREERLRGQLDIVLTCMETKFVQLDRDLRVVRINRAAAAFLKQSAAQLRERPLQDLFPVTYAPQIEKAARKAMETGMAERRTLELQETGGRLCLDITPFPPGVALFWADVTQASALAELHAQQEGEALLLSMMTGCATGEIRRDGMLAGVHPSLKRLLRFREEVIARTCFADLFEVGSRRKCRLHVAHVLEAKGPVCCRMDVVTRDRDAVPVRLFLAPKMAGETVESVLFSILDDALGALPMR